MSESQTKDIPSAESQTEEWFLAQIGKSRIDVPLLLTALRALRNGGHAAQAEQRVELLQDTLAERKKTDEALEALHLRARWAALDRKKDINWTEEALDILGGEWAEKALVDEAGFSRPGAPAEAVRRLRMLLSLKEGVLVYDRTWGLGVVNRVDSFNKKVEIDFDRRVGHLMSLSYAGESLSPVGEDHLLMWKRKRAEELRVLVRDNPAEVVRMALRSLGPLTVAQLQAALVAGIVNESDWKKFWEAARKKLKADPSIYVPASRSEPLHIQDGSQSQEDQWFDTLARERSLPKIVTALEELAGRKAEQEFTETQQRVLLDRLAFGLKGATSVDFATPARLVMAASELGLDAKLDGARVPDFFQGRVFDETIKQLPSRPLRLFLHYLYGRNREAVQALLLARLERFEIGILNEAMLFLQETNYEQEAAKIFKHVFDARTPSLELLSWLGRHVEKCEEWKLGSIALMAQLMVEAVEQEANGERLKAQNQLRERFSKREWLKDLMSRLSRPELEHLLLRIKESTGWPALDRASVLGHMVKNAPDLAPLLAARDDQPVASRGPITSHRSYRERQQLLDRIINVEIPQVAKDIALARSYGDLRENHEYKAAKEAQTILFRRRDELMADLHRVAPSDFRDLPFDKAGLGTVVTLEYGDGKKETYSILGVWDGDPDHGIISSNSRMAETLIGHTAGERLTVPSEHGETQATLVSVQPLSAELLELINRE